MTELSPNCPGCLSKYCPGDRTCAVCGRVLETITAETIALDGLPDLEPSPPTGSFRLVVQGTEAVKYHGQPTQEIIIGPAPLLIGRRDASSGIYPDVDLQGLADYGYTARQHARIVPTNGRLFVTDLKGQGMTAINDAGRTLPANEPVELLLGDRLIIGEAITFVVLAAD